MKFRIETIIQPAYLHLYDEVEAETKADAIKIALDQNSAAIGTFLETYVGDTQWECEQTASTEGDFDWDELGNEIADQNEDEETQEPNQFGITKLQVTTVLQSKYDERSEQVTCDQFWTCDCEENIVKFEDVERCPICKEEMGNSGNADLDVVLASFPELNELPIVQSPCETYGRS
jgi:rubrerythrin